MRRALTYQNVMATIAAVLLVAGGTAFAASQLGKNSVGTKQLKKNSVTAKKIKKNAVTAAKIKKNAVTTAKIADGGVKAADVDTAGTPYSHIVARIRSGSTPFTENTLVPLGSFTQAAGELVQYIAFADITFSPSCTGERSVSIYLILDPGEPVQEEDIVGVGSLVDQGGNPSGRVEFTSFPGAQPLFSPASAAPTGHIFSMFLGDVDCDAGDGATLTGAGVDVIGSK
jgi:hypothetical protein